MKRILLIALALMFVSGCVTPLAAPKPVCDGVDCTCPDGFELAIEFGPRFLYVPETGEGGGVMFGWPVCKAK